MSTDNKNDKLWAGRFSLPTDKLVEELNASIGFDKRLYEDDIAGSIAHAKMLGRTGIISLDEAGLIIDGLNKVLEEIRSGNFTFNISDEDIHMAVEKRLIELVGAVGGKLHTARSRNDQVALDTRHYTLSQAENIKVLLLQLEKVLIEKAENNIDAIMPGFTHLQIGQPILFSHYLMAYFQMFKRDFERMSDLIIRASYSPLGSGALAGTTFAIDRAYTASELGFYGPTENSIDSVSDRDFLLELLSAISISMMHLSRFSEEIILFSNPEFNYITLTDDYCTGSSIMPQKKNPDVAELVRGKTGRVYGDLISLLTTMKGLPLAYNKDMQEDKEPLFDAVDTIIACLKVFTAMVEKMEVNKDKMRLSANKGFSTATDLADYLTRKGVPFRQSHHIVGTVVSFAIAQNKLLEEITLEEYKGFSPLIEEDIYENISLEASINARNSYGGTAKESVLHQLEIAKNFINENI